MSVMTPLFPLNFLKSVRENLSVRQSRKPSTARNSWTAAASVRLSSDTLISLFLAKARTTTTSSATTKSLIKTSETAHRTFKSGQVSHDYVLTYQLNDPPRYPHGLTLVTYRYCGASVCVCVCVCHTGCVIDCCLVRLTHKRTQLPYDRQHTASIVYLRSCADRPVARRLGPLVGIHSSPGLAMQPFRIHHLLGSIH